MSSIVTHTPQSPGTSNRPLPPWPCHCYTSLPYYVLSFAVSHTVQHCQGDSELNKLNCTERRKLEEKYVLLTYPNYPLPLPLYNSFITFLRKLKWGIITSYFIVRGLNLVKIYPLSLLNNSFIEYTFNSAYAKTSDVGLWGFDPMKSSYHTSLSHFAIAFYQLSNSI